MAVTITVNSNSYVTLEEANGIFTITTAGNIALAGTAVVGKALIMTYDNTTSKWYSSY